MKDIRELKKLRDTYIKLVSSARYNKKKIVEEYVEEGEVLDYSTMKESDRQCLSALARLRSEYKSKLEILNYLLNEKAGVDDIKIVNQRDVEYLLHTKGVAL